MCVVCLSSTVFHILWLIWRHLQWVFMKMPCIYYVPDVWKSHVKRNFWRRICKFYLNSCCVSRFYTPRLESRYPSPSPSRCSTGASLEGLYCNQACSSLAKNVFAMGDFAERLKGHSDLTRRQPGMLQGFGFIHDKQIYTWCFEWGWPIFIWKLREFDERRFGRGLWMRLCACSPGIWS